MAPLSNHHILVTGGAGFIGSHLTDHLIPDNDVVVLDDFSSGDRSKVPDDATIVDADIRDTEAVSRALEDVDTVFHQAALVSVAASIDAPTRSHAINVDGTLAVLEGAREVDARVVLASSAAIYGHPETVPVPESAPKTPASPYGLEKLTIDHYARLYHERYGLEAVPLRYFNVYGPGQRGGDYSGVIDIFLEQARADAPITVHGDGSQTRDFVHVEDVVRANVLAATTDAVGRAYNVGTGSSVTVVELAELIRDATDSSSEIVHTGARDGDIDQSRADLSRSRNTLGYEPTVALRDGIADLVAHRTK
ncbi:NAD-dependent epimerase/dehydratase family protein [Salinadaptatus halalkaliphilus]|uniref:NAD-dependent epimerase/dehydratase family protein n=1 Tax=Salinadaptatus halalkaliphilus TaxID=2419781 RepID=A0A4S3TMQ6_9EURY|nr:NAD-dependent epimerase/dehydratase family protein [Salinadaptatus halalkaliphilus]THE64910.1 NAD-dependent epimerase/dehydratase family protein [Salinadaptatus halalkaliphilus]